MRPLPPPRQRRHRDRAARSTAVGDAVPRRHRRAARRARRAKARVRTESAAEGDEDDDFENQMSLAAIEAELKPKVVETFDKIADSYKKLRRLQEADISNQLQNETLSPAQERKYKKLKDEIIVEVKSLRLNQARIDSLVEQLYDINKKLVSFEGPSAAARRQPRRRARRLSEKLSGLGARSEMDQPRLETLRQRLEEFRPPTRRTASRSCAAKSSSWRR